MNQHETIVTDIHLAIEGLDGADTITAQSVADALLAKYADDELNPYIAFASLEHFKQMARQVLGAKFDVKSQALGDTTGELFSEQLQERYPVPAAKGDEHAYKRLDALTEYEVAWNVQRLERAGRSLLAHARTLRAWQQNRTAA